MLPMLMMRPKPRSRMPGKTARVRRATPISMTWTSSAHRVDREALPAARHAGVQRCSPACRPDATIDDDRGGDAVVRAPRPSRPPSAEPPGGANRRHDGRRAVEPKIADDDVLARSGPAPRRGPAPMPLAPPVIRTLSMGRSPVEQGGAPGQAAAEAAQHHARAWAQATQLPRLAAESAGCWRRPCCRTTRRS